MQDFTFYGDESYGKADAFAVAGYVATVEQWESLGYQWRNLAKREGFKVLHKSDLETNVEGTEFEWSALTDRGKAIKKLRINSKACRIISDRVSAGFGLTVQKSEWQAQVAQSRWAERLGKSFYAAGVFSCLNLVSSWADTRPDVGMIRYVFEEGADGRDEAEKMLRRFKRAADTREKYRIAGYSFESKKDPEFLPLQVADFLAYESYRQVDNRIVGGIKLHKGKPIEPRGALRCLLRADDPKYADVHPVDLPTPYWGVWLSKETIGGLLTDLDAAFPDPW